MIWRKNEIVMEQLVDGRKKIVIKDYELIENIDMLFRHENYIYGAGHDGKKFVERMRDAGIRITAFVDKIVRGEVYGYAVMDIAGLKRAKKQTINIIIASSKYFDEILEDISRNGIDANIFSVWGVDEAIEKNINNIPIDEKYKESVILRKAIRERNFYKSLRIRMIRDIGESDYRVLIYQMGKVGSTTLWKSISKYEKCLHVHHLNPNIDTPDDLIDDYIYCNRLLKMNNLKIITMIREPITRFISDYFSDSHFYSEKRIMEDLLEQLDFQSEKNYPFEWFKNELEYFTSINVFDYDFDKERGYGIIKKNNFEILCLQTERMRFNEQVIGEFLGIENFHLCEDVNVGDRKASRFAYKKVRENIEIPYRIIERYYGGNNQAMNHFYSVGDQERFVEKFKK